MVSLTMQLDWLPNAQFAGLIVAQEEGWYAKQGIGLTLLPWRPYLNQVDVLRQEGNLVVSTDDNLLIKAAIHHEPVVALATMLQYSGLAYMVPKEHKIKRFEQLRGKRIGIHTDGRTGIAVALDHVGLTPQDVSIVEVGFEYPELLRNHELDAMQCLAMVEPIEMEEKGFDLDLFMAKDLGYLAYAQVIASNQRTMEREASMLQEFLEITFDGWRAALADPDRAASYIVSQYHKDSKIELESRMIQAMYPLFSYQGDMQKIGMMEEERWVESIRIVGLEGYDIGDLEIDRFINFDYSEKLNSLDGGDR